MGAQAACVAKLVFVGASLFGWGAVGLSSELDAGAVQVEYRAAGAMYPAVAISDSKPGRHPQDSRIRDGDSNGESNGGTPSVAARQASPAVDSPEEIMVRGLAPAFLESFRERNSGGESLTMRQWQAGFRVSMVDASASLPPLFGTYVVTEEGLAFRPRFPLRPGHAYLVTLDRTRLAQMAAESSEGEHSGRFDVARPKAARPQANESEQPDTAVGEDDDDNAADDELVERFVFSLPSDDHSSKPPADVAPRLLEVFPSGSVLPENQLKFYLHFSTPMRRGQAYQHVSLWVEKQESEVVKREPGDVQRERSEDAGDSEDSESLPDILAESDRWERIEFPFLELPEELWDPDYQRFTLFFDPGRIKRGLKPREQFGPALEEGRRYVLEVDRAWKSASGEPLEGSVRKSFRVVAPDDRQPDFEAWGVVVPQVADGWLRLELDEPMDHAMLQRVIHVEDSRGRRVEGEVRVDQGETRWNFRPAQAWQAGSFAIVVGTHLEDRAGNSLAKPFEVDLFDEVETRVERSHVRLPFRLD